MHLTCFFTKNWYIRHTMKDAIPISLLRAEARQRERGAATDRPHPLDVEMHLSYINMAER